MRIGNDLFFNIAGPQGETFTFFNGVIQSNVGVQASWFQSTAPTSNRGNFFVPINPAIYDSAGFTLKADGSTRTVVGKTAYNVMLNYFNGDYKAVSGATPQDASVNVTLGGQYRPLYNGNISSMAVNVGALNNPLLYNYQYDQLNRLVAMDSWKKTGNAWNNLDTTSDFRERVGYDANGNILSYIRNGNTAGGKPLAMDRLAYNYKPGTNQLDYVHDTVPAGYYDVDIDAQATGNYAYDSIGNLIKNKADRIASISWTLYGKISQIKKDDGTVITYTYGTDGNRISKSVVKGGETDTTTTWYVRDASGNVMSVYESGKPAVNIGHLTQSELHLYGSSRLGLLRRKLDVAYQSGVNADPTKIAMPLLGTADSITFVRGDKLFELSNHLGNVLVTLNDKKLGVSSNNTTVDYFNPQVVSAQDYYPFGMLQPGRSVNASGYRYGFNGKENDNEVKGEGEQQDYGMRVYDPRLGRFLSVDPITKDYPELTPYQFASNRPIDGVDMDGLEFIANGTAMFKLSNGWVELNNGNVPEVFTNEVGKPLFNALGIGLTGMGKVDIRRGPIGGYNNLPEIPNIFTFDVASQVPDIPSDLWTFGKGYKYDGERKADGRHMIRLKAVEDTRMEIIGAGSDFFGQVQSYAQLWSDTKLWKASGDLNNQINVLDQVIKIVDEYINMEGGMKTIDAFNKGEFSRDDLVNFVFDGSLPGGVSVGDMFNSTAILKNLDIMYYGMQIIKGGEGRVNGRPGEPWDNTIHTVKVSSQTLDTYNSFLDTYKTINPGTTTNLSSGASGN